MKDNIVQQKSFEFAVLVIELYKKLVIRKEFILSKQILRSGTSVGANIEESIGGQSKNDFIAKISIAYKEARETYYWLKLLLEGKYITKKEYEYYEEKILVIIKLLTAILKTSKKTNH